MSVDAERLPVRSLDRLGVVVADLDEAMTNYGEIFGVDQWQLFENMDRIGALTVNDLTTTATWRSAIGTTPSGAVRFELIEPGVGLSAALMFRALRGPGVMQLTFTATDRAEGAMIEAFFARRGVPVLQRYVMDGTAEHVTFDTRALLGGYFVNYVIPTGDEPLQRPTADRLCDISQVYTKRPPGVPAFAAPKLHHIGIVVKDVMGTVGNHASVYDIDTWNFINWRHEQGRLESPFYRGEFVNHEYLTGRAFNFHNFGFELVQPTFGPSHYKEDFLQIVGEGIHHLLVGFPEDEEKWEETVDWLDSIGVPLVMGSEMRGGSGRFYYLDARDKLGGYVIEATFPRAGRPVVGPINDFSIDYAHGVAR